MLSTTGGMRYSKRVVSPSVSLDLAWTVGRTCLDDSSECICKVELDYRLFRLTWETDLTNQWEKRDAREEWNMLLHVVQKRVLSFFANDHLKIKDKAHAGHPVYLWLFWKQTLHWKLCHLLLLSTPDCAYYSWDSCCWRNYCHCCCWDSFVEWRQSLMLTWLIDCCSDSFLTNRSLTVLYLRTEKERRPTVLQERWHCDLQAN